MFHYTDIDAFKAIASQPTWVFKAFPPPASHPKGAYFTMLPPDAVNLARRLRIPRRKLSRLFQFIEDHRLMPIEGDRGAFIFYSPDDYDVARDRQKYHGPADEFPENAK